MLGILNTVGEVGIGWAGDRPWVGLGPLYAVCMLLCGVATAVVPFLKGYVYLAVAAGVYGFAISANYSLTSSVLVELVSLEQFSSAYGLLLLVQVRFIIPGVSDFLNNFETGFIPTYSTLGRMTLAPPEW